MPETIRTTYARLFEVRLLHHYWLDNGSVVFDSASAAPSDLRRLLSYDIRRLLSVQPSAATADVVAGLRGVMRMTGLGFFVAVPSTATVPLDTDLTFYVAATSPGYDEYTALTLRPRRIVEVVDPTDAHHVHRYCTNVPELSNLSGASTAMSGTKRLYLSRPYHRSTAPSDGTESLISSSKRVWQFLQDRGGLHPLGTATALPVYLHQGDVRPIIAPPASTGAPSRGVELGPDAPADLVAVLKLRPRPASDPDFDFTSEDGGVRTTPPVFEVHFRNRWTFWRYLASDGSMASEAGPFPLTHIGNPHTARKPPPEALLVEHDAGSPGTITRLVSEIRN